VGTTGQAGRHKGTASDVHFSGQGYRIEV
jgi:hypothetical protein